MFTFPTGSMNGTELCVNIAILNDDCFENSESFTVLVDDVPTNVFAHTGSVDVTIEDEDSKYKEDVTPLRLAIGGHDQGTRRSGGTAEK